EAELLILELERMPSGVLTHNQLAVLDAYGVGPHDLVGRLLLQHAVLMDARFMREGIASDYRLVGLDDKPREVRQELARRVDLGRLHPALDAEEVTPRVERHDDLLERGVAGPLPDAVDRTLHLAGALLDGRQRVRHGETEVIVAVHRDHGTVD